MFRSVKSCGFKPDLTPSCTSFHVNGVETPPNALARALYAHARVLP